jgi:hypothetical protein
MVCMLTFWVYTPRTWTWRQQVPHTSGITRCIHPEDQYLYTQKINIYTPRRSISKSKTRYIQPVRLPVRLGFKPLVGLMTIFQSAVTPLRFYSSWGIRSDKEDGSVCSQLSQCCQLSLSTNCTPCARSHVSLGFATHEPGDDAVGSSYLQHHYQSHCVQSQISICLLTALQNLFSYRPIQLQDLNVAAMFQIRNEEIPSHSINISLH